MDVMTARSRALPLLDGLRAMRTWLVASLICNMSLIVTGAVVRVTGSGLGCSTWPKCHAGSYVPHAEASFHAYVEFGNRLLTFVLAIAALGAFISVWRTVGKRTKLWWLTLGIGLGIPFQGVIGGITVLTQLNPWVVALHMLLSVALVVLCVWSVLLGFGRQPAVLARGERRLVILTFALAMISVWLGTVVTGAGPHAGDLDAVRNGLDIVASSRNHSLSAWAVTFATVVCVVRFVRVRERVPARASLLLLATLLLQGVVGYIQYFLGLPTLVVILHLVGASLVSAAAGFLLLTSTSEQAAKSA